MGLWERVVDKGERSVKAGRPRADQHGVMGKSYGRGLKVKNGRQATGVMLISMVLWERFMDEGERSKMAGRPRAAVWRDTL